VRRSLVSVDSAENPASVIAFCAGYGGIERGLELAGVNHRVVAYVEIEAFAIANLVAKMEAGALASAPIWSDLKTFPAHLFRDRVDLVTGGYPCQPFSNAGKRRGTEDPRHLWPYLKDHVRTIRPVQCFFENVEGHINRGLQEVVGDLEELGYEATWGVFSASEVGAPHQRKRVFILADANGGLFNSSQQEVQPRWNAVTDGSKTLADPNSERQRRRTEATGRQTGPSSKGLAQRAVDDTVSAGLTAQRNQSVEERSEDVTSQPSALADADIERLEGHTWDGNTSWEPKQAGPITQSSFCKQWGSEIWSVEPNVGRVVDGSTFRVDRLRLLGNGVVPQQAAKAWIVLSEQVNEKDDDRV